MTDPIAGSIRTTAVAVVAAILTTACSFFALDTDRVGFELVNRTEAFLTVTFVTADASVILVQDFPPGGSLQVDRFVTRDQCVDAAMAATAAIGQVLAAFPGPVCDGTVWEIVAELGME